MTPNIQPPAEKTANPRAEHAIPATGETRRRSRILVAGQVPPPVCGQNLNIARVLRILRENPDLTVEHWPFRFTRRWTEARRAGFSKAIELVRVWGRLLKLRWRGKIDVILFPVGGPHLAPVLRDLCLLPLARIFCRRVILHFRAAGLAEALPRFPGLIRWLIKRVYRGCGEAIVLTEFGKRDPEAAEIPGDRISVVPNACEDRYDAAWKKSGRQKDDPIILFNAGLLCPDKGTPALVEAFGRLAAKRPELRLKLAGEPMGGSTAGSLHQIAEMYGVEQQIELTGLLHGADLDRAYAEADLFVFPTVAPFESFGMVLIEAMMWELPIVATDWRGNAEVLGPDPGALLAESGSPAELTGSLQAALEQALESIVDWPDWGRINRKRFQSRYQIPALRQNLESALTRPALT